MVLLLQIWQADEKGVKTCLFSSGFRWANEIPLCNLKYKKKKKKGSVTLTTAHSLVFILAYYCRHKYSTVCTETEN